MELTRLGSVAFSPPAREATRRAPGQRSMDRLIYTVFLIVSILPWYGTFFLTSHH